MIAAAIVGLGRWGRNFVESIHGKSTHLRFVRAVEPAVENARAFAAAHGLPLDAEFDVVLIDDRVQAVVLATPHSAHLPQVIAAAAAGKHVFCEKPLALTLANARLMVDACRNAGVVLGIGANRRLWPSMQALRRFVESGESGELLHLEGNHSNENSNHAAGTWRDDPAESPGGGLSGAGLHILDTFVQLAGPLKRAHGQLLLRKPAPAPLDTVAVALEFESGVSGLLGTVRATPYFWRVHAFGTHGSAESVGETELILRRSGAPPERLQLQPFDSLRAELEAFADAIEGRAPFPITPHQMLETVAAFEAVMRSLECGGAPTVRR
jgi:predicted dehydrogenase